LRKKREILVQLFERENKGNCEGTIWGIEIGGGR
jgi:hypothetical protein